MEAVMVVPPVSSFTRAVVCPFTTSVTLPLSVLRALTFMIEASSEERAPPSEPDLHPGENFPRSIAIVAQVGGAARAQVATERCPQPVVVPVVGPVEGQAGAWIQVPVDPGGHGLDPV